MLSKQRQGRKSSLPQVTKSHQTLQVMRTHGPLQVVGTYRTLQDTRHSTSYQERLDKSDIDNDILHRSILNPEVNTWAPPCNKQEENSNNAMLQLMARQASYLGQIVQQQQNSLSLTLLTPEVPTFEGNPIEYCTFVSRALLNQEQSVVVPGYTILYNLQRVTSKT